jgi:hypothetical protein
MNWKNFFIAIAIGIVLAAGLVLVFQRWPHLAESPITMLVLFLLAFGASRLMRRFIRK